MQKWVVWSIAMLTGAGAVCAEIEQPHILVYGTAEMEAVPDKLVWNLTVKTIGADVQAVAAAHATEVSAVLDLLKTKVDKKEIQTDRMRLAENWIYRDRNRVQEGYVASTAITFTGKDFSQYLSLWTGLSVCRNTSINSASFQLSNRRELEDQARLKAVANAREKAAALASAGGVMLYEPIAIEEMSERGSGPVVLRKAYAADALAEPIEPGTETVQASVSVYFRIGPKN
jgi:uncharacterized protein YggE